MSSRSLSQIKNLNWVFQIFDSYVHFMKSSTVVMSTWYHNTTYSCLWVLLKDIQRVLSPVTPPLPACCKLSVGVSGFQFHLASVVGKFLGPAEAMLRPDIPNSVAFQWDFPRLGIWIPFALFLSRRQEENKLQSNALPQYLATHLFTLPVDFSLILPSAGIGLWWC